MNAIGAVTGVSAVQMAQITQSVKPGGRDADHDSGKPDPLVQPDTQVHAVAEHNHKLNVEA